MMWHFLFSWLIVFVLMIQMLLIAWEKYNRITVLFSTVTYLRRAGRILCCRKTEKLKKHGWENVVERTISLSQALDYLDNLEISSDSEEESLGDLHSAKIYLQPPLNFNRPTVMLILVIKTQQHQIQVILVVINFLVLLYWK